MSQQPATFEFPVAEWSPVRWAFHVWSWIALLVLFVVLEIWVDPLMASLVLCLKLGWRDLLVAMRLRSYPHVRVASAIGLYCLAQACFKVALAGMLLTTAVIACEVLLGIPQQLERCLAGFVLLFSGLVLGAMMVLFAAARSSQYPVRDWLDGTIYENLLRPRVALHCRGTFNRVPWLVGTGMLLVSCLLLPAPITAVVMLVTRGNPAGIVGGVVLGIFWISAIRPLWAALNKVAQSPEECWGKAA
jgi:hypothetical protein